MYCSIILYSLDYIIKHLKAEGFFCERVKNVYHKSKNITKQLVQQYSYTLIGFPVNTRNRRMTIQNDGCLFIYFYILHFSAVVAH